MGKNNQQSKADTNSNINDGDYDSQSEAESCNVMEDDADMIVELIEGDFAEKLGFSTKAWPVSSKENTGWSEVLYNLVRLSVLYEAEQSEDTSQFMDES